MIQNQGLLLLITVEQRGTLYTVPVAQRKYASIGDIIVVAVKNVVPLSEEKGSVARAVVVRTRKEADAATAYIRFDDNVRLLNPAGEIEELRTLPVARELRDGYMKIASLAPEVL